ncbi:MAG: hypothetical protein WC809_14360 [Sinimarinibacterium sp.]|jgi:hypothetical protein
MCKTCEAPTLHRAHRTFGQWLLSCIVPVRPLECDGCGTRAWGLLHARDGIVPWLTSLAIWGGLALLAASKWMPAG